MRRFLCLFLVLSMFALLLPTVSCTPTDSGDGDNHNPGGNVTPPDGGDDPADNSVLTLVKDEKVSFRFVYAAGTDKKVLDAIDALLLDLEVSGVETTRVEDTVAGEGVEILVGADVNREGCKVDLLAVGEGGYIIRVIGNKIVIAGGSVDATQEAIEFFAAEYIKAGEKKIKNLTIAKNINVEKKTEYKVTSVKVAGKNINNYTIVADEKDTYAAAQAQVFQAALYSRSGIFLPIAKSGEEGNRVVISCVNDAGTEGFRVRVSGTDLLIECAYCNSFDKGMEGFLSSALNYERGDVEYKSNFSYKTDISTVYYSDFGAVGDGKTDDLDAIIAAHAYANVGGQTVRATAGKTYYIAATGKTVTIRTNTDWTDAKFIIDDSKVDITKRGGWIFNIAPSYDEVPVTIPEGMTLTAKQQNLGMTFDHDLFLIITNSHKKQYIRYGNNANSGADQRECILVDRSGNVDPSTPLLWDYSAVTGMVAYRADETPITLKGGEVTTIANQAESKYNYYARGIIVTRCNTTIRGVKHYITGELDHGAPYTAFIMVSNTNKILIDDCVFTGHLQYQTINENTGQRSSMGSYEIQSGNANNVTWSNCTQTNEITDPKYWGVHASNYSKNLTMVGCILSRFDAHASLYNATVKNCTIGLDLNIMGAGTLYVENVTRNFRPNFMSLRGDYGASWDGDIIIKNCNFQTTQSVSYLLNCGSWVSHDYGYPCTMPHNITIENFTLLGVAKSFYIFNTFTETDDALTDPVNPYGLCSSVKMTGYKSMDNIPCKIYGNENSEVYKRLQKIFEFREKE